MYFYSVKSFNPFLTETFTKNNKILKENVK